MKPRAPSLFWLLVAQLCHFSLAWAAVVSCSYAGVSLAVSIPVVLGLAAAKEGVIDTLLEKDSWKSSLTDLAFYGLGCALSGIFVRLVTGPAISSTVALAGLLVALLVILIDCVFLLTDTVLFLRGKETVSAWLRQHPLAEWLFVGLQALGVIGLSLHLLLGP